MEEQEIIDLLWQRKEEGLTALQENFTGHRHSGAQGPDLVSE